MTVGVGAAWMFLTIVAAAFLGSEFVVQEIRVLIRRRRDPEAE
jgi:hypothetical protein